jgi:hypothetical protein
MLGLHGDQSFAKNETFASMKCAVENWETGSNAACLLSCCFLSPLSIVEKTSFVTPYHLGVDGSIFWLTAVGGKTLEPKTEFPQTGWFAIFANPAGNRIALYTSTSQQS